MAGALLEIGETDDGNRDFNQWQGGGGVPGWPAVPRPQFPVGPVPRGRPPLLAARPRPGHPQPGRDSTGRWQARWEGPCLLGHGDFDGGLRPRVTPAVSETTLRHAITRNDGNGL